MFFILVYYNNLLFPDRLQLCSFVNFYISVMKKIVINALKIALGSAITLPLGYYIDCKMGIEDSFDPELAIHIGIIGLIAGFIGALIFGVYRLKKHLIPKIVPFLFHYWKKIIFFIFSGWNKSNK